MKMKSKKHQMRSFVYGTLCLGSSHLAVMAVAETDGVNTAGEIKVADAVESISADELKIEKFIPHFRGVEIEEFITSIGKTLNLTMIIDPAVRGKVNTRSSQSLTAKEYYQFFLNTLEVYGYAAVRKGSIVKIMRSKDARTSAIPVASRVTPGVGDEFVTQIVPLYNVEARKLAPKLRQLNSSSKGGNVVNYDDSNVLILTGRAAVVEKLIKIIGFIDKQGDAEVEVVPLRYAAANDIVKIVNTLNKRTQKTTSVNGALKVVADERTNSVIVTGNEKVRLKNIDLIRRLDFDQKNQGNIRVRYLKFAQAEDMVDVLNGFSKTLTDKAKKAGSKNKKTANKGKVSVVADKATNALVITAQPDEMASLNKVIDRLDIRPLQVLIEAIIVEVEETDNEAFGIDFLNKNYMLGAVKGNSKFAQVASVAWADGSSEQLKAMANLANTTSSLPFAISMNDWVGVLEASITNTNNNVLATPQIFTVDNQEARVFVGSEVSVDTGQTINGGTTTNSKERKSVGTELKVTPQVIDGTTVRLTILQSVDSLSPDAKDTKDTFNKRQLTTTVVVNSGSIVPLGGLVKEQMKETEYKIPLLGDIPLLGRLFRNTSSELKKTNLMIFIRPTIVSKDEDMREMAGRKYNYMRYIELNNKENGLQPVYPWKPDAQPTLQNWESQSFVPEEVKKVVDYYEHRDILNQVPASQFIQTNEPAATPPAEAPSIDAQPKATGLKVVPVPSVPKPPAPVVPAPVMPAPQAPTPETVPAPKVVPAEIPAAAPSMPPATAPKVVPAEIPAAAPSTSPKPAADVPASSNVPVDEVPLIDEPLPSDLDLIEAMNEVEFPATSEEAGAP